MEQEPKDIDRRMVAAIGADVATVLELLEERFKPILLIRRGGR